MTMFYKLKVHPGARQAKIDRKGPDAFEIWVKAPAERGLANQAAIELLGRELGIEPGKILLIKGAQSPAKIVKVPPDRR